MLGRSRRRLVLAPITIDLYVDADADGYAKARRSFSQCFENRNPVLLTAMSVWQLKKALSILWKAF